MADEKNERHEIVSAYLSNQTDEGWKELKAAIRKVGVAVDGDGVCPHCGEDCGVVCAGCGGDRNDIG